MVVNIIGLTSRRVQRQNAWRRVVPDGQTPWRRFQGLNIRGGTMGGKRTMLLVRGVAVIMMLTGLSVLDACGPDTTAKQDESSGKSAMKASSTASKAAAGERGSRTIPQP